MRRKNDPALCEAARIRSTLRWRNLRRRILAMNPLCADPFGRHVATSATVPAREVHHIRPLVEAPELAFAPANLMALCSACHARIEGETIPESGELREAVRKSPSDSGRGAG